MASSEATVELTDFTHPPRGHIREAVKSSDSGAEQGPGASTQHHPKDPSYYPLTAHLATTGQILTPPSPQATSVEPASANTTPLIPT